MPTFRKLNTQGGNFIKWDKPKTVRGILVGFQRGEYKGKPTMTIILKDEQGVQFKVPGSTNIENSGLYNEQPGVTVEFVFKGKGISKGGNTFNDIDVFVDSPEPEPGTAPAPAPQAPASGESYDALVARLQLTNPNGAKAVLAALDGMNLDPAAKAEKLREFLKVQG